MSAPLRGKQVAFTGTFESMNRAAVVARAKAAGALVQGRGASVSKNVDFLVTGESNVGMKKVKAQQLGITVVPPHSFLKFVKAGGPARMSAASASAAPRKASRVSMDEDFEEDTSAASMPWETDAPVRSTRRAAPMAVRRQQKVSAVEDFEQDEDETTDGAMPWETDAPVARGRARMSTPKARRELATIERPVRKTRNEMVVAKPAPRSSAAAPFWTIRGKSVAFTGSFEQLKKTEAAVMAERNGANVHTGMGHQIDILVCGKGSEAKRMLAKKKGILAVSETTFIAACRK